MHLVGEMDRAGAVLVVQDCVEVSTLAELVGHDDIDV